MKELFKRPFTFEKIEFWLATGAYVFSVYVLVYDLYVLNQSGIDIRWYNNANEFWYRDMSYSYYKFYLIPHFCANTIYYCCFVALNFFIVKSLISGKRIVLNIVLLLVVIALTITLIGTTDTWLKAYLFYDHHTDNYVYRRVFKSAILWGIWATMIFAIYTFIKYLLQYALKMCKDLPELTQVNREAIFALIVCASVAVFLGFTTRGSITFLFSEASLLGIALYWYSFYKLIPQTLIKKRGFRIYLFKVAQLLLLSLLPVTLLVLALIQRKRTDVALIFNLGNIGISVCIVAPLAWYLYNYRLSKNQELYGLKTALGRSTADLDFLRSQINPHFLFNALNTLYATSLQEHADRTGEGIQKLGDMMRFMLQENVQEKISLSREIDYLNNYIDLQKLRTQTSPDILIQVEIEEQLVSAYQITPMLLIPFVENAFKHGISLREPSHIKITLHIEDNKLLFDVYNSIHLKTGSDPEKDKSGIGLENVKQRLQLLYPGRHELIIRENSREFFIHLTTQL